MRTINSLALILVVIFSVTAKAENVPYYTKNHTWALSTTPAYGVYPRVAFLPSRYLLYIDNRSDLEPISSEKYVKAVTQDGVEVYVLDDYVSKKPFKHSVGRHEIIFNSQYALCNKVPCQRDKESDIWPVSRGDAFFIVDQDDNGYMKIQGGQEEPIIGYIAPKTLEELKNNGQVTRTDQIHPRYKVTKSLFTPLSTACGVTAINTIEISAEQEKEAKFIVDSFDMGSVSQQQINLSSTYGEPNYLYEFFHYQVNDVTTGETFQVASANKFYCEKPQFGKIKRMYISQVVFKSSRREDPIEISIDDPLFKTSTELRDYTSAPYLISINSYNHFERIIDTLSKKIGDRTLAGYALSEINVSCKFSERRKSDGPCVKYDYAKSP